MPTVDVFRILRAHRVMSQVPCPLVVLKKCDACRTKTRQNKTPHVPQENHLLDGVCLCCVLGFCGRKRHALLSPRKPAHACRCAYDSPAGNRSPISGLASVVCIRIRNHLQSTASMKRSAKINREKYILHNTNRRLPVYLPGQVGVLGYRPRGVRNVRTCPVSKPRRVPYQFAERPVGLRPSSSGFVHPELTLISPLTANPAKICQIPQYVTIFQS